MTEQSDRLRKAWKTSGLSQSQCVERYGWNRNTFKANLNGNGVFSFHSAQDYGKRFNVRAEWLMTGADPMRPTHSPNPALIEIPLISWVAAGELHDQSMIDPADALEYITVSDLPQSEYFATTVIGDSMDRISPEGSQIIVDCLERAQIPGKPYLFSLRGATTYKMLETEPVARLEPYSTNPHNKPIYLNSDRDWSIIGRVVRSYIDLN